MIDFVETNGEKTKSTFVVKNATGGTLFYAVEMVRNSCTKCCIAYFHTNYEIVLFDLKGDPFVVITRPANWCGCVTEVIQLFQLTRDHYLI